MISNRDTRTHLFFLAAMTVFLKISFFFLHPFSIQSLSHFSRTILYPFQIQLFPSVYLVLLGHTI